MRVLAIDPGETVGLAVVDSKQDILYHAAIPFEHARAAVIGRLFLYSPTVVAMESPPQILTNVKDYWAILENLLRSYNFDVVKVSPGTWKPLTKVLEDGTASFRTQHEKDAVCIARYFIREAMVTPKAENNPIGQRGEYRKKEK